MLKPIQHKTVRTWVQLSHLYIEQDLDIPEECFEEDGTLIEDDASEFVEKWITNTLQMEYGAYLPIKPDVTNLKDPPPPPDPPPARIINEDKRTSY